jgi:hypothetical protein
MSVAVSTIAPARTAPVDPRPKAPVTRPQCMEALDRANEVRLARAAMKREIRAGRRNVIEVVLDCPWQAQSMPLLELLGSQRRWGRARSQKLLNSVGLKEMKALGSLTQRQRGLLVRALYAKTGAEVTA